MIGRQASEIKKGGVKTDLHVHTVILNYTENETDKQRWDSKSSDFFCSFYFLRPQEIVIQQKSLNVSEIRCTLGTKRL